MFSYPTIFGAMRSFCGARGVVQAFFSVSSIGVVVSLCYPLIRSSITAEELTAIWGCTASPIVGAILLRLNVKIGVAIVTTYGLGMASLLLYAAQSFGFDVRVVSSANGFMELYDHGEPSVIVMDIFMPDMDGIELLIWLGDRQCTSHIVLMSGHGPQYLKSATNIASARGVRIVGTLSKPF